MVRPGRRAGWLIGLAAVTGCTGLVWHASDTALSAPTATTSRSDPGAAWSTGSLALSNDQPSSALFAATNLKPGTGGSRCVAITATGRQPATVKLYGTSAATTKGLASWITLTIDQGTGTGTGTGRGDSGAGCAAFIPLPAGARIYAGTLDRFAHTATGYPSGLGTWTPSGTGRQTRVFRFGYSLDPATPNSAQAGTARIGFTWQAQQRPS